MAKAKYASPQLTVDWTDDDLEVAKKSASGGCLIADGIKRAYPHLSNVSVDMATIRATDRKKGLRYIYLTPPAAQTVLLYYDQGWPEPVNQVVIRGAVQVVRVVARSKADEKQRAARLVELEQKKASGEKLTTPEKQTLTRLQNTPPRPASEGKREVGTTRGRSVVVAGGKAPVKSKHPNLLAGRNRHFGAKISNPGEVFQQAVDEAVAQKLAEVPAE
jgi:hypothetical protein